MGLLDSLLGGVVEVTSTVVSEVIAAPFTIAQKSIELVEKTVEKTTDTINDITKNI